MLKIGKDIIEKFLNENGEIHLSSDKVEELELLIDFKFHMYAESRMSCDFKEYLQSAIDDVQHTYSAEEVHENYDYYADCWARGLSAYKANCFLSIHLEEKNN
jgi:hypothetical protein